jgi:hypothetical protein
VESECFEVDWCFDEAAADCDIRGDVEDEGDVAERYMKEYTEEDECTCTWLLWFNAGKNMCVMDECKGDITEDCESVWLLCVEKAAGIRPEWCKNECPDERGKKLRDDDDDDTEEGEHMEVADGEVWVWWVGVRSAWSCCV